MLIKNALVYRNKAKSFERLDVKIIGQIIADIGQNLGDDDECLDLEGMALVSGLVDVHTHGMAGVDFANASHKSLHEVAKAYAAHGVTSVMPTVASAPLEDMLAAIDLINDFSPECGEAYFCGVHLEGRYLNPLYRGAHDERYISALDWHELDSEILKKCRHLQISAAYELDIDGSFASMAQKIGATLSLAHTAATYDQARKAEERGVVAYTHLFNAMSPLHHRDGGAACAALTGDKFAELICDGYHIAPQVIRLAYSMLTSERTVLITDSMEGTGCSDGEYFIAGSSVTLRGGKAITPEGVIAGSTLTLDVAVRNLMELCQIPLSEAIVCATENPARQIGAYDQIGSIDIGKRADILVLDSTDSLNIKKIMIGGNFISI